MQTQHYDHYIAIDWSMSTMAVAKLTGVTEHLTVAEHPSSIEDLKAYLKSLKGSKILTVEESNYSQWFYVEVRDHVDQILVCDPYRNSLLSDGPKTDKIDATKLVRLLKAGLLKEVFHTTDQIIYLRKLVSHYQDVVRAGVMIQNQRSALFRSYGLSHKQDKFKGNHVLEEFVVERLDAQIELYEKSKLEYEKKFKEAVRKFPKAKLLKSIPGVGDIQAVALMAAIIDPRRFATLGHLYSYAGLIRHEKMSGGRSYGKRKPRYSRELKRIIKMITFIAIRGDNRVSKYYQHLLTKGVSSHNARHASSRKIAAFVYGVLKSERTLDSDKF